jgi:hypothetical protein
MFRAGVSEMSNRLKAGHKMHLNMFRSVVQNCSQRDIGGGLNTTLSLLERVVQNTDPPTIEGIVPKCSAARPDHRKPPARRANARHSNAGVGNEREGKRLDPPIAARFVS